jgi:hypothetical protein
MAKRKEEELNPEELEEQNGEELPDRGSGQSSIRAPTGSRSSPFEPPPSEAG